MMTTKKELQMAKDFVLLSMLISDKKEFIFPDYYKSDLFKEVLEKAIEELQKENLIIVKNLASKESLITFANDKINECIDLKYSLKEKVGNYNKLKAIKNKSKRTQMFNDIKINN